MKLWFNCEVKFIFYYFISEIIIKSPFSATSAAASSSLPFISIARIALTATTTTMKREKISLEGNFYFIFYFYENGAAEWRWWLSFEKTRYLFMTEYIKKIMKSQHSHHQQQPTFLSKKNDCLYPFTFASLATASSHKDEFNIYTRGPTFHSFIWRLNMRVIYTWVCVCVWWVHKMVIKNIKSPHNQEWEMERLISSFLFNFLFLFFSFMYPHSRLSLWLYKIIFSYLNYKHASLSPSFSSIIIIIICVFSSSSPFQSFIFFLLFALISFNGSWSSNEKKVPNERMLC